MKKTLSAILVCVLLVSSLFALTSCSTMVLGKYSAEISVDLFLVKLSARETYEFDLFGKVTKTIVYGTEANKDSETYEGKYAIEEVGEGKFEITITWNVVEGEKADKNIYSFVKGQDSTGKYIVISGVRYDAVE